MKTNYWPIPTGSYSVSCQKLEIVCRPIVIRNDLDLRCIPELRRLIRTGAYDIVHLHTKRAHALALWLPRFHSRPRYLVTRRMDYPESNNWYTHCLYNRRVDGVVAISQKIAELLRGSGRHPGENLRDCERHRAATIHGGAADAR